MPDDQPIDRALFRESEDGATIFFPWGLTHRGYRLPDDAAKKKASRAASFLVGSTVALGTWTAYALQPTLEFEGTGAGEVLRALAAPGAVLFLVIAWYFLWASRFVEGFPESDLEVSR
jgi:hypothetical protein